MECRRRALYPRSLPAARDVADNVNPTDAALWKAFGGPVQKCIGPALQCAAIAA